jgi:mannose-6-phosphate isomerase-like protein (cupin superfamily)
LKREPIRLRDKLALFSEQWSPKIVAEANGHHIKLAKIEGEFVWHSHEDSDEVFLVVHGEMIVELRDQAIPLGEGDLFVVPKGVEHRTVAARECHVMVLNQAGTVNTGKAGGPLTADGDDWI